jgi:hypothetical protein
MSQWATDHLVFRSGAVHAADGVSQGLFGEPAPFNQGKKEQPAVLPGSEQADAQTNHDPGSYPKVIEGSDDWMFLGLDVGSKCRSALPLPKTIEQLRKLRTAVDSSGRKLIYVIAPDKSTMKPEHLPSSFLEDQCWRQQTSTFWQRIPGEAHAIDLRPAIREAEKSSPVYFPQDAHWADEGGLLLTRHIAEEIKSGVSKSWVIRDGESWVAKSDIPPLMGRSGQQRGIHYQLAPDGGADRVQYPAGNYASTWLQLSSAAPTGTITDKVAWLGDSFTPYSTRYLAAAFQDIAVTHYQRTSSDPAAIVDVLKDRKVVVIEVAERGLASGASAFLKQEFIDRLGQELQKHPVR